MKPRTVFPSYVIPKEGSLAWMATFAVLADSPNPTAGFAVMNSMLEPGVPSQGLLIAMSRRLFLSTPSTLPMFRLLGCNQDAHPPVLEWGAATGFDSGEPRKRRKIERTTRTAVDRNSDCQF